MQRLGINFEKTKRNARVDKQKDDSSNRDYIDNLVLLLVKGDITKRDEVLWGYTIDEVEPYIEYLERDILFREAVIGTLVNEKETPQGIEKEYCKACKKAGKDDCENCSRHYELHGDKEEVKKVG
jgi:hypothetical protein